MRKKGGVFMLVHLPKNGGVTMIENTFIDQLMPAASGDFVKIYLYLLRCSQNGLTDVTISQIADALNYTESDVRRAMGYWQKQNMLVLEDEEQSARSAGSRQSSEESPFYITEGSVQPHRRQDSPSYGASDSTVSGGKITEFRSSRKASGEELRSAVFVAENYLGRPLSQSEQQTLSYFLSDLGMDIDLVDYLLDYCISRNHTSFHYISKVAQNWADKGIHTAQQARLEGSSHRKEYYAIFRELGIQDHTPTQAETDYIDRWLSEYSFTMDLIVLACRRTILQIGKPQFSYVDSILKSWHENNVRSADDIQKLDRMHEESVKRPRVRKTTPSAGNFANFESSERDWNDIALQVMNAQEESLAAARTQES